MLRLYMFLCALALFLCPMQARAEVIATFYSHDFGDHFPHTFFTLKGTVDATGEAIDTNFGFTAKSVSPAILFGSVEGMIETKDEKYIGKSNPHFTFRLSDAQYQALIQHVESWRAMSGKSYNLGKRNCVHFVMEAAALLGLSVNRESKFFKKPKSFVLEMMTLNPHLAL